MCRLKTAFNFITFKLIAHGSQFKPYLVPQGGSKFEKYLKLKMYRRFAVYKRMNQAWHSMHVPLWAFTRSKIKIPFIGSMMVTVLGPAWSFLINGIQTDLKKSVHDSNSSQKDLAWPKSFWTFVFSIFMPICPLWEGMI